MGKQPRAWIVDFDSDAVIDFEDVKSRGDRKAVFNVVQKLKDLGPDLPSPHMKSLKGEANLFELRPKQGGCEARPIYADSAVDLWFSRWPRRRKTSNERLRLRASA
jgi:hypothetical protein